MTLTIYIHGKVAVYRDTERIVTDNTDYTVAFDLSDSGFTAAGTKYLVLITDLGKYDPIPFTGSTCNLPAFTHADGASVKIGIYEGDLSTTTYAEILLTPSILGIEAADAEPSDSGNVPVIEDPDDISDDDEMILLPNGGVKSHVSIDTLKAIFGGGFWKVLNGALVPDEDVSMNGHELDNCGYIGFNDGTMALPFNIMTTAPTSSTQGNSRDLIFCSADGHFYVCMGANRDTTYTWRKLVYADEAGTDDVFNVIYGTTSMADILTAYSANKIVQCKYIAGDVYFCFSAAGDDSEAQALFVSVSAAQARSFWVYLENGQTSYEARKVTNLQEAKLVTSMSSSSNNSQYPSAKCVYDALLLKQTTSNLVTILSAQSDDTHYPSAKCVYDTINAAITDAIEEAY